MRARVIWTSELDAKLCALRIAGWTWNEIAAALKLGRNTVLERGRKIGARRGPRRAAVIEAEARGRPPMSAGHPNTWAALWDGLETPVPAFARRGPPSPLPECRWPSEDDAGRTVFVCGADRLPGCSYCAEHQAAAYPKRAMEPRIPSGIMKDWATDPLPIAAAEAAPQERLAA
jgi:hypothetical protein